VSRVTIKEYPRNQFLELTVLSHQMANVTPPTITTSISTSALHTNKSQSKRLSNWMTKNRPTEMQAERRKFTLLHSTTQRGGCLSSNEIHSNNFSQILSSEPLQSFVSGTAPEIIIIFDSIHSEQFPSPHTIPPIGFSSSEQLIEWLKETDLGVMKTYVPYFRLSFVHLVNAPKNLKADHLEKIPIPDSIPNLHTISKSLHNTLFDSFILYYSQENDANRLQFIGAAKAVIQGMSTSSF
jgi:hypothetical protein